MAEAEITSRSNLSVKSFHNCGRSTVLIQRRRVYFATDPDLSKPDIDFWGAYDEGNVIEQIHFCPFCGEKLDEHGSG